MRIAFIHVAQETNDFNPVPTTLADFAGYGILEGNEIIEKLKGHGQLAGHFKAVAESGLEVETIPIIRGFSVAGGRITREAFDFFADKMVKGLQNAGPLDGLALHLHGACAAVGIDDADAEFTRICREVTGGTVPTVLMLDHHANITAKMVANCDAIMGHRTQPHDHIDTGYVGAKLLLKIVSEKIKPVMAWRKIPLVSHQEQFLTTKGPMKVWFDRARAMEAENPHVLQASNYPMQPWLDVSEGGWADVVVTDGDRDLAETLAEELADLAWSMRANFQIIDAIDVDEAVRQADAEPKGLVIISDTGDTVFGGSTGDSTILLESMLRQNIKGRALVPMISKATAEHLYAAGEGATVTVTLPVGGTLAPEFFTPIEVTGTVRKIGGGVVPLKYMHQSEVDFGKAVIFDVGPVTMLITEKRGVAGNLPDAYRVFGVEPADYKMAVMKTASNFYFFDDLSSRLIRANTRGPGMSQVLALPWKRLPRPIYPLDPIDDWHKGPIST